jgi:hypothetical protein
MRVSIGSWSQQAACKGYLSLFYPKDAERPQARDRREQRAKTLCAICPVLDLCKDHARNNTELVFGAAKMKKSVILLVISFLVMLVST